MNKVLSIAAIVASLFAIYLNLRTTVNDTESEGVEKEASHEYPLLETMGYYQRFSQKIWFAIEKENWELAAFYAEELEEVTEEFVEAEVVDEGLELSQFAEMMLMPAVRDLEGGLKSENPDVVTNHYKLLVKACNSCHVATKHAFIQIETPEMGKTFNQNFGK